MNTPKMSLDIGRFLKAEIAKKKNELAQEKQQSLEITPEAPPGVPPGVSPGVSPGASQEEQPREESQDSPFHNVPAKLDDLDKAKRKPKSETDQDILQRLKTRPDRVGSAIEKDSERCTAIDPACIAAKEKTRVVSIQCNLYIHELLNQWSNQGYKPDLLPETKKSLFPLLVRLRKCTLAQDLLTSLATVLYHIQVKELHLATESYMKLSIGNVAWPIGVTSVGIHARSAQTRIQGDNGIANVMLDDRTRLWITSVKRLITFKEFSGK